MGISQSCSAFSDGDATRLCQLGVPLMFVFIPWYSEFYFYQASHGWVLNYNVDVVASKYGS